MSKILVIAEKPAAGRDIAKVLGVTEDKGNYMENDSYIVTWAVGHLIELKDPEDADERYRKWNVDDIPLPADNGLRVKESGRAQFNVIKKLIARDDVSQLINAGDAGREGLLIQEWIYRMAGNRHPVKILWASSLTAEAIRAAMGRLHDSGEEEFVNLLREAETRAVADQVLGYNYTRLLTCLFSDRTVLSYGRCQTPLLNLIVKRDLEYENFKSQPYWTLFLKFKDGFTGTETDEEGKPVRYMSRDEADRALEACQHLQKARIISCSRDGKSSKAPELFNLAELQGRMGKKYGLTPDKTLAIAQSLYEKHKILSYPRTDSRFLSTDLYTEIGEHLQCCRFGKFEPFIDKIDASAGLRPDKKYFNDNKVSDHHALIPTINRDTGRIYDTLSEDERNCFDEIVVSLIAVFYPEHEYETTEILSQAGGKTFKTSGTTVKSEGWKQVYRLLKADTSDEKPDEESLPELSGGTEAEIGGAGLKEDKTKPPARYNPGNIIKLMGRYGIGTSATSAGIVQSLINRKFIRLDKNKYVSTELGREFLKYVPTVLKSPNMTVEFERKLRKVNSGEVDKEAFINELLEEVAANKKYFLEHLPAEKLSAQKPVGKCPACGGNMREGKKNWYCENHTGCDFKIWKEISGKKISEAEIAKILDKRKSGLIEGFVSGKTGNKFSAYLVLGPDNTLSFEFPQKKRETR
ncbi:MAG: DNA topoisomerase [Roseburia sp.]|nr:DNA topoisomerase [Roseburia sp.]